MAPAAEAEIRATAELLDELDYYQLLEIQPNAPSSAIRGAYHRISRRFHPDANRALPPETMSAAARIAKRVAEAYSVLRNPRRRQVYDQKLSEGAQRKRVPLAEAEAQAHRQRREESEGRTPNGRRYFAMAKSDLARGDRAAAERNLKMALTFEPQNSGFLQQLEALRQR